MAENYATFRSELDLASNASDQGAISTASNRGVSHSISGDTSYQGRAARMERIKRGMGFGDQDTKTVLQAYPETKEGDAKMLAERGMDVRTPERLLRNWHPKTIDKLLKVPSKDKLASSVFTGFP
jgi:hypothetical protein